MPGAKKAKIVRLWVFGFHAQQIAVDCGVSLSDVVEILNEVGLIPDCKTQIVEATGKR